MKKNKNKKESERAKKISKLNKSGKLILIVMVIIFLILMLNNTIMYFSSSYSDFYIIHIHNVFRGILFYLCSFIPFSSVVIYYALIGLAMIFLVLSLFITYNKKLDVRNLNKKYNKYNGIALICIFIIYINLFISCFDLHLPLFEDKYYSDYIDKDFTVEDLVKLNDYYIEDILNKVDKFERDSNNNIICKGNYNDIVVSALKNSSNDITYLKGLYPNSSGDLNDTLKGIVGNDTIGLTHLYNTYFDYDMDPASLLPTILHEYIHTKSFTRESETEFLSCYVGQNSKNDVLKYGTEIGMFYRVLSALNDLEEYDAVSKADEVNSLCLTKGYSEICADFAKNNKDYINGAFKLSFSTYSLKYYKGYEDELEKSLKILSDNGAKIYLNSNKKISVDKVLELIENESNDYVYIGMKIDKKKYNKIKPAIKNGNLYYVIYQINYEEEESNDKDNLEDFYLKYLKNNGNYYSIFTDKSAIDFTYERVTRLLLIYHDKFGY